MSNRRKTEQKTERNGKRVVAKSDKWTFPKVSRSGNDVFVYFRYRDDDGKMKPVKIRDGKRFDVAITETDKAAYFDVLCDVVTDELKNGYDPFRKQRMNTIKDKFDYAIRIKASEGLNDLTVRDYRNVAAAFVEYLQKHTKLQDVVEIKAKHIVDFLTEKNQDNSNANYNNDRRDLSASFSILKRHGIIEVNPIANVKKRRQEDILKDVYNLNDCREMLPKIKQYNEMLYICCLCCLYAFMRPDAEVRLLQRCDVDLMQRKISIQPKKTKNKRFRAVPINTTLLRAFTDYFERYDFNSDSFIFHNNGAKLSERYFSAAFRKWKKHLKKVDGIEFVGTLYQLKDTGCTWYYQQTKDIQRLSTLCGHREVSTTMRYIRKLGFEDLRGDTDCLPTL